MHDPYWNQGELIPNMGDGCVLVALKMIGGLLAVFVAAVVFFWLVSLLIH